MDHESCNIWLHNFRSLEAIVGDEYRATCKACELRYNNLGSWTDYYFQKKPSGPNFVYLPLAVRDILRDKDATVFYFLNFDDVLW
jgi:hypothetical protein